MPDYLPPRDADFSAWAGNFNQQMADQGADFGFLPADLTSLAAALGVWGQAYQDHLAARNSARARRQDKQLAREALSEMIRGYVRRLQANPLMTDPLRADFGITVPGMTPPVSAETPLTRPLVNVDTSQRLRHRLYWADELTPTSRRRPAGVRGAEIWAKIDGTPPSDPSQLAFLATATRPQFTAEYDGDHSGKTVYYMVRWISNRSQTGPWSQTIAATIVG